MHQRKKFLFQDKNCFGLQNYKRRLFYMQRTCFMLHSQNKLPKYLLFFYVHSMERYHLCQASLEIGIIIQVFVPLRRGSAGKHDSDISNALPKPWSSFSTGCLVTASHLQITAQVLAQATVIEKSFEGNWIMGTSSSKNSIMSSF